MADSDIPGSIMALALSMVAATSCGDGTAPEPLPEPTITAVQPTSVLAGAETPIVVDGSGLGPASVVRWNGTDLPTTGLASGQLRALFEKDVATESGRFPVTVWNPPPGGGKSEALWVTVRPNATIEGRVAVGGQGVGDVAVRLDPAGGPGQKTATGADSAGHFEFGGLEPGSYTVGFELPGTRRIVFPDSVKEVRLGTDTSSAEILFAGRLQGLDAAVVGSVTDTAGGAIPDVEIRASWDVEPPASVNDPWRAAFSNEDTVRTGRDGRYELAVPSGSIQAEAVRPADMDGHRFQNFQALSVDRSEQRQVDLSVSDRDTATANFGWVSCMGGSLEYGQEVQVELTKRDCVEHSYPRAWEVWTFGGREGDFVNVFADISCETVVLRGHESTNPRCVGEAWIITTLQGGGPHYVRVPSDGTLAGGPQNRLLFVGRTSRWSAVAAGGRHSCGLSPEGRAWCWGDNTVGQLGDGTLENSSVPVPVTGDLTFRSLTAGAVHTCGITTVGALYCWGGNAEGQLGDGTTTARARPVRVGGSSSFGAVSASVTGAHTCAVARDSGGWCWGENGHGQLGDGSTEGALRPVPIRGDMRLRTVAAGGAHTCALTEAGEPYCWGANGNGQLGDGARESSSVPVRVSEDRTAESVAAGARHACAVVADPSSGEDSVLCWGRSRGADGDRMTPVAVDLPWSSPGSGSNVSVLSAGGDRTCVVYNNAEQLDLPYCRQPKGAEFGAWTRHASISVGGSEGRSHVCSLALPTGLGDEADKDIPGAIHCWGSNGFGQLGHGTLEDFQDPRPVKPRPGQ